MNHTHSSPKDPYTGLLLDGECCGGGHFTNWRMQKYLNFRNRLASKHIFVIILFLEKKKNLYEL